MTPEVPERVSRTERNQSRASAPSVKPPEGEFRRFGMIPIGRLPELIKASDDQDFQREVLRTTAALDYPLAVKRAERLLDSPMGELRNDAIRLLGQRPATAEVVVKAFNDGKIPRGELPLVIEAVRHHSTPSLQASLQLLLKRTILAAPNGEEAARLREHVNGRRNADRGKALFLDSRKGGCAACHRIEGVGNALAFLGDRRAQESLREK
jgi:quinoprotein glucose dehydrogenase